MEMEGARGEEGVGRASRQRNDQGQPDKYLVELEASRR